jgi:hypothetical protein
MYNTSGCHSTTQPGMHGAFGAETQGVSSGELTGSGDEYSPRDEVVPPAFNRGAVYARSEEVGVAGFATPLNLGLARTGNGMLLLRGRRPSSWETAEGEWTPFINSTRAMQQRLTCWPSLSLTHCILPLQQRRPASPPPACGPSCHQTECSLRPSLLPAYCQL